MQLLRELRGGAMSTGAGSAFMGAFHAAYYSFLPAVADLEREHPLLRDAVRAAMAPALASLDLVDASGEAPLLAAGMAAMMLNLGLYVAAPAALAWRGAAAAGRLARR